MTVPAKEKAFQPLAAQMDAFLTDPELPVIGYSVSLIQDGRIAYERSGGYRRYDADNPAQCLPMDRDTRYRIASISKMFTCTAIMQQVELGRMSLDEEAGTVVDTRHDRGPAPTPQYDEENGKGHEHPEDQTEIRRE